MTKGGGGSKVISSELQGSMHASSAQPLMAQDQIKWCCKCWIYASSICLPHMTHCKGMADIVTDWVTAVGAAQAGCGTVVLLSLQGARGA